MKALENIKELKGKLKGLRRCKNVPYALRNYSNPIKAIQEHLKPNQYDLTATTSDWSIELITKTDSFILYNQSELIYDKLVGNK